MMTWEIVAALIGIWILGMTVLPVGAAAHIFLVVALALVVAELASGQKPA